MTYSGAQQAKAAREILSNALSALQATANIPPDVLAVTTHVAGSLGALFDAERSSSEIDGKACVRRALEGLGQTLALLQDVRSQHEAIARTTELIAKAMTIVFPLTQKPSMRPPGPGASSPSAGARPAAAATVLTSPAQRGGPPRPAARPAAPATPAPHDVPPPPSFVLAGAAQAHPPQPAPPAPAPAASPYAQPGPAASPHAPSAAPAFASPAAYPSAASMPSQGSVPYGGAVNPQATPYAPQQALRPASSMGGAAPPAPAPAASPPERPSMAGGSSVEANIGATTESNFYVGFSGEISEGGIFLATYDVRPVGQPVEVHLTLPGGFEERVQGHVRWVRDPHDGGDTTPGMGIGFVGLTAQQRELILRFVRKRAPMFYDE